MSLLSLVGCLGWGCHCRLMLCCWPVCVCWLFLLERTFRTSVLQKEAMVGIVVAAKTIAGNPKKHTPRRRAGPRARTNNTRRGAREPGTQQPATAISTPRTRERRKQRNTQQQTDWRFLCVCAFDGFLLWFWTAYACPTTASLRNNSTKQP